MNSLIQHFEADFLWKVSLKILNSGIILKTFACCIMGFDTKTLVCCMQTAKVHTCSLISAFVFQYFESTGVKLAPCKISIFSLVSVGEQAGLSLRWSETLKTG